MKKEQREAIQHELNDIYQAAGGFLHPHAVRDFAATHEDSAIRKWMNARGAYDEKRALSEYQNRLCRELIMRVRITVPDGAGKQHNVRAYVSIADERKNRVGYRGMVAVMADDEQHQRLLATAMSELRAFERKYQSLEDILALRPVFQAIHSLQTEEVEG